ncbi:MAG: hypothetical protein IJE25_04965 [Clostridia bacterium]|nr:hypothetical protein [Clostridia bacterium]
MKKIRLTPLIYLLFTAALILIGVSLRSVALIGSYNFTTGYFSDKLLIGISDGVTVLAVLGAVSYLFTGERKKKFVATYEDPTTYIPSALVAVATVFLAIELCGAVGSRDAVIPSTARFTAVIAIALAALSAVAFFVSCLRTDRRDATRAAFQITAVLFLGIYAAFIYFENPLPINVPSRIVDIMAYLSAAVFLLYEARLSLGRDLWGLYTVFGLICAVLCAYSSIPSIITYFALDKEVSHSVKENVLTLALFLFSALRLIRSALLFEDTDAKTVAAIKLQEAARDNAAEGQDDGEAEDDGSQESPDAAETNAENYTFEIDGDSADEAPEGEEE